MCRRRLCTQWWLINVTVNADKNKINIRKSLNVHTNQIMGMCVGISISSGGDTNLFPLYRSLFSMLLYNTYIFFTIHGCLSGCFSYVSSMLRVAIWVIPMIARAHSMLSKLNNIWRIQIRFTESKYGQKPYVFVCVNISVLSVCSSSMDNEMMQISLSPILSIWWNIHLAIFFLPIFYVAEINHAFSIHFFAATVHSKSS